MTLSDFATFTTAVSGIAVTVSIVYLALQTHQSSKHTRALLLQGQTDRVVTTLVAMADPAIAEAWIAGNGGEASPAAIKGVQFAQICNALVYDMSDFYNQNAEGLAKGEQYEHACVGYSILLRQPGMRAYWEAWRDARVDVAPDFIAWVDRLAAKSSPLVRGNPSWV
jgi:hypothetical protein